MTSTTVFLLLLVSTILSKYGIEDPIQYSSVDVAVAYYPGDGCCIQWNVDGTCCLDIYQQCCGGGEAGNVVYANDGYGDGGANYYGGDTNYFGGNTNIFGGGGWGRVSDIHWI